MTSDPALASRYGAPRRKMSRRAARILVVVGLVVGMGVAAWLAFATTRAGVTSKDVGFSTPDAWHAEIDFEVTKDAGSTAVCALQALSETYAVVGYTEVEIGPDPTRSGPVTTVANVPLRTESAAVSAVVDSCWIKSS